MIRIGIESWIRVRIGMKTLPIRKTVRQYQKMKTTFFHQVLEYKAKNKRTKETLLTCLADLFYR
jgi:hypothetical protein